MGHHSVDNPRNIFSAYWQISISNIWNILLVSPRQVSKDMIMVFILDGCSFHVAHILCKQLLIRKKGFDDSFDVTKSNRNAWFTQCVRIVKWGTIFYKNHGLNYSVRMSVTISCAALFYWIREFSIMMRFSVIFVANFLFKIKTKSSWWTLWMIHKANLLICL